MIFLCPYLHCKAPRTAMYKCDINSIIIIIIIMFNKSIDHENGLICFLFIMCTIFLETSMEMDVVTLNVIVKNKSTTIFHGLTLIDHRHDLKMFKHFAVKPLACGSWFYLSFEHVDITSMVDKSTDHMLMIYEINHIWPAEMKWRWLSQWTQFMQLCKEAWKKNSGLQRGLNLWLCDYRCDALPTELWSHWRWEQVNGGFICSRERNDC